MTGHPMPNRLRSESSSHTRCRARQVSVSTSSRAIGSFLIRCGASQSGGVEVPGRLGVAAALRLRQDRARSKCSAASFTAMMAREHTRSGSGPGELALQALLGRWENR